MDLPNTVDFSKPAITSTVTPAIAQPIKDEETVPVAPNVEETSPPSMEQNVSESDSYSDLAIHELLRFLNKKLNVMDRSKVKVLSGSESVMKSRSVCCGF